MKPTIRLALVYGPIAGTIAISALTLGLVVSGGQGVAASMWFGYLIMLVALTMIFIAVKGYRDRELGGIIKFWPAFGLGLAIAVVAGVFYVIGWEIFLALTDHAFIHDYTNHIIETKKASGITGEALAKITQEMAVMVKNYSKPFLRRPMTFLEIFPVGLLMALISAVLLRNPKFLPIRD